MFAHGLGASIPETRVFGSAVDGTKVYFQFRGHGRSDEPPGPWTYADLADDLGAVADRHSATRALGVSLGAAALLRLLTQNPERFVRIVIFLPAVLDQTRPELKRTGMHGLWSAPAVPQTDLLAKVGAPALVIGATDDEDHPVPVAEAVAAALPNARLHVYDRPAPRLTARDDLRRRISTFLNA